MSYKIHYLDSERGGADRTVPLVLDTRELALDHACALRRAGFHVARVEGPNFELADAAFEAYYGAGSGTRPTAAFAGERARP